MKKNMVLNSDKIKNLKLTKRELTLISLYQTGGNKGKIHTEEICYKAFQINRELFSWNLKKFKNYPDIYSTYKALGHLREEKKVYGTKHDDPHKDGWMLTEDGLNYCNNELADFINIKKNKSNYQQSEKSFIISIKKSDYFKAWKQNNEKQLKEKSIYDIANFLKVLTSNIPRLIEKFYETKVLAKEIDENVYDFLSYIENIYTDFFNEENRNKALIKSKKILKGIL